MSWQADAHRDWHTLNALEGGRGTCPWDCLASEDADEDAYGPQAPLVRCGWCGERQTVAEVRDCSARHYAERAEGRARHAAR